MVDIDLSIQTAHRGVVQAARQLGQHRLQAGHPVERLLADDGLGSQAEWVSLFASRFRRIRKK